MNSEVPPKLRAIAVVGPTGVGKSDMGVYLAERFGGEVVSADSMQIYRFMDIGTAKIPESDRRGIRHHMIDIVSPDDPYTVADYQRQASTVIDDIALRGKRPIVVGGTGLYVRALREGLNFSGAEGSSALREQLMQEAVGKGNEFLHARLAEVDPVTANRLHANDVRRVVRALEVFLQTGTPLSQAAGVTGGSCMEMIMVGLTMEREALYNRLDHRVDTMIAEGLVQEVKSLLDRGYRHDLNAMQAIGYKEIIAFLMGKTSLEEAVELVKQGTRRYAKRQWSWYRRDSEVKWFHVDAAPVAEIRTEIAEYVEGFDRRRPNIVGRL